MDPIGQLGGVNVFTYARNSPTEYSDFDGLNPAMEIAAEEGVRASATLYRSLRAIANTATAAAAAEFPQPGLQDGQDALQHCIASCESRAQHGNLVAVLAGTGREARATERGVRGAGGGQTLGDLRMDLHNNAAGRRLADSDTQCPRSCTDSCKGAYAFGILTTVGFQGAY